MRHSIDQETAKAVLAGAVLGLAWGTALRGWMASLALEFGDWPRITAAGTFGSVLAPATVAGGLLGWAYACRRAGRGMGWRWTAAAPLLLAVPVALLTPDFFPTLLQEGLGGGAVGAVLVGMCGGYAVSGRGPTWGRVLAGLVAALVMAAMTWFLYLEGLNAINTASRAYGALTLWVLMVLLVAAASIPHRPPLRPAAGDPVDEGVQRR